MAQCTERATPEVVEVDADGGRQDSGALADAQLPHHVLRQQPRTALSRQRLLGLLAPAASCVGTHEWNRHIEI